MSNNTIIKSNDPDAVQKLTENIESIEGRNTYMQTINDYFNVHGTTKGCDIIDLDTAYKLDSRVTSGHETPYPGKFFSDNFANIRRLNGNIERLKNNPDSVFKGWQFRGGEAVVNLANNRLQLFFDDKPKQEDLSALKQNGFKWAPSFKAWQRKLDSKAFAAADKIGFIKPTDGRNPSDIQPKTPKRDAPER